MLCSTLPMNFLVGKNGSTASQYFSERKSSHSRKRLCSCHTLVCSPQGKEAEENGFNKSNLTLVTADLLVAGSETTATTLRWAFLFMLLYPEIQSKWEDKYRCGMLLWTLISWQGHCTSLRIFGLSAIRNSFGNCWSGRNQVKRFPKHSCSGTA